MMCEWCVENNGEPIGCQDCGMMICLDHVGSDDVISEPFVTTDGDVYCLRCGQSNQREIDRLDDEDDYIDDDFDPYLETDYFEDDGGK